MKHVFLLTILTLLIHTQLKAQADLRYILIRGMAETEVEPDEIDVTLLISASEKSKLESEVLQKEKKLLEFLHTLRIDSRDIVLEQYTGRALYGFYGPSNTRYVMGKKYVVTVHQASLLDSLFNGLLDIGITNVAITRIDHSEIERIKTDLLVSAVDDAMGKAGRIAEKIGAKITTVLSVSDVTPVSFISEADNSFLKGVAGGLSCYEDLQSGSNMQSPNQMVTLQRIRLQKEVDVKVAIE